MSFLLITYGLLPARLFSQRRTLHSVCPYLTAIGTEADTP